MPEVSTCSNCGGNGVKDESLCPVCFGIGSLPAIGIFPLLGKKLFDLESKLDAIITEQISQREDLTAALTQIWNKVKDL